MLTNQHTTPIIVSKHNIIEECYSAFCIVTPNMFFSLQRFQIAHQEIQVCLCCVTAHCICVLILWF